MAAKKALSPSSCWEATNGGGPTVSSGPATPPLAPPWWWAVTSRAGHASIGPGGDVTALARPL